MSLKICIVGAAGRMGKNIAAAIYEDSRAEISGALDRQGSEALGQPIYEFSGCGKGGVVITDDFNIASKEADVIIDFTGAAVTISHLTDYEACGIPVVVGSTGFSAEQKALLASLAVKIPLLIAPNMSLGVNVLFRLAAMAAKSLKGYDIEIIETHHRMKKDAPSGTALGIAEAVANAADIDLSENAVYCRHGLIGERKDMEIGVQTIRGGDVVGDHTVFFFGNGERIEITHRAHTRATFAEGAVAAAKWIKGKPAGLYSMQDVLF
ncbi:MAG: 4-hydroxy-tetrahydrodipicolinate reductase [Deferribacterales bacterium]|nr:4-hydroxy-tetrahydrodipicolinate reductase [Deferribacterales bacterium]